MYFLCVIKKKDGRLTERNRGWLFSESWLTILWILLLFCLGGVACLVAPFNIDWLPCGPGNTCAGNAKCYYVSNLKNNFCLEDGDGYPIAKTESAPEEVIVPDEKVVEEGPEPKPEPKQEPLPEEKKETGTEPLPETNADKEAIKETAPEPTKETKSEWQPESGEKVQETKPETKAD